MNIRRFFNIAALSLVGVATLTSCSDWLDVTPDDKTTEDQLFGTRAGFYAAVNGTYNQLASSTLYGKNLSWGALDLAGKRYAVTEQNPSCYYWANWSGYMGTNAFTDETYVKPQLNTIWSTAYNTILNANVILKNLEINGAVLGDNAQGKMDKAIIAGDMLALRAMLHLDIMRFWGPTPMGKNLSTIKCMPYNDKAEAGVYDMLTAEEVAAKIIADLDQAESLLAVDPVLTEGPLSVGDPDVADNYTRYRQLRVNALAIAILKARTYLWIGDKEKALAEAQKITDNPTVDKLFPNVDPSKLLSNTVNPDRVFSTEVLFGVYNKNRADIFNYNFSSQGLNYGSAYLYPRETFIKTVLFPSDKQGDYRFQSQWKADGVYDNFVKFQGITYDSQNPPLYAFLMPLIRKSEAYYIAAECLRMTDAAKAVEYINKVKAARGTPLMATTSNANAIMTELNYEYQREFWGEGQIFFHLKRTAYPMVGWMEKYQNAMQNIYEYPYDKYMTPPTPEIELSNR